MENDTSLGARLKTELTKGFMISVVAALMALLAFLALYRIGISVTESGFLLIAIAIFIPYAYDEYWPISYSGGAAVVWTISAALITSGLFMGTYQLAQIYLSSQYDGGIAFVATVVIQYGIAALFMRIYQTS